MAHDPPHVHDHGGAPCAGRHDAPTSKRRLALAVAITLGFVAVELSAGLLGHSLALVSDAGHNFADALALGLSWYAIRIAARAACRGMTFGYHRVGILAALVNSLSLALIAIFIVIEAVARLCAPEPVNSPLMMATAGAAIVVNLLIGSWLHGGRHDLNVRGAYLHMIGDAVSAFGVVVAGAIAWLAHAPIADPIVSLLIAGLILFSSWGILRECVTVLLEGSPPGLNMADLERCIGASPGVLGVHHLHVWTVGSGIVACSCHIVVPEQGIRQGQELLHSVSAELERRFGINHTTVQIEVEACQADEMYCSVRPAEGAGHVGHHH